MESRFRNRQLRYLFFGSLIVLIVGMGTYPLLALFAAKFGATPSAVGVFLAVINLTNTAGALLTARLADRLGAKRLFVSASAMGVPALFLMPSVSAFWQVIALTAVLWFGGGTILTLISILTGVFTREGDRGRWYSLIALTTPLGALIGGALASWLLSLQGYGLMFTVMGAVWIILPLIGLLGLKTPEDSIPNSPAHQLEPSMPRIAVTMAPLLIAALLSAVAINTGRLGVSFSMQALDYSGPQVANTSVVAGLVAIPATLLFGALSDRVNRKRLLTSIYIMAAAGSLVLSSASELWQFYLATTLMLVAFCSAGAVASALVADALPQQSLSRGLSALNTVNAGAGILSSAGAGVIVDTLGGAPMYIFAAVLSAIAVVELKRIVACPVPDASSLSGAEMPMPTAKVFCV